jgi:hypothetical protein
MSIIDSKPVIASFWYGSDLSWLEQLCIRSFLDRGHRFVLYTAEDLAGVPSGVEVKHASDILWPPSFDISDNDRLKVAVFSDIFRLHIIAKTGFLWVDLDAYCVRSFSFESPYVFATSERHSYPNGVMGLPKNSSTLIDMITFLESPNPTQPWRGTRLKRINRKRVEEGESWGIESLPWGCSGPKAFEFFLKKSGEVERAMPTKTFYPIPPKELWKLHDPSIKTSDIEQNGVHSVHIYGHQKKLLAYKMRGLPIPNSYLDRLCRRHGIAAEDAPIKVLNWMVK